MDRTSFNGPIPSPISLLTLTLSLPHGPLSYQSFLEQFWEEGLAAIDPRLDYVRYSWLRTAVDKTGDALSPVSWALATSWRGPDAAYRYLL